MRIEFFFSLFLFFFRPIQVLNSWSKTQINFLKTFFNYDLHSFIIHPKVKLLFSKDSSKSTINGHSRLIRSMDSCWSWINILNFMTAFMLIDHVLGQLFNLTLMVFLWLLVENITSGALLTLQVEYATSCLSTSL